MNDVRHAPRGWPHESWGASRYRGRSDLLRYDEARREQEAALDPMAQVNVLPPGVPEAPQSAAQFRAELARKAIAAAELATPD